MTSTYEEHDLGNELVISSRRLHALFYEKKTFLLSAIQKRREWCNMHAKHEKKAHE